MAAPLTNNRKAACILNATHVHPSVPASTHRDAAEAYNTIYKYWLLYKPAIQTARTALAYKPSARAGIQACAVPRTVGHNNKIFTCNSPATDSEGAA